MAPAEAAGHVELSVEIIEDRLLGRRLALDHEGLNAVVFQLFRGPPSHAVAQNDFAIPQGVDNRRMTVFLIVMVFVRLVFCILPAHGP